MDLFDRQEFDRLNIVDDLVGFNRGRNRFVGLDTSLDALCYLARPHTDRGLGLAHSRWSFAHLALSFGFSLNMHLAAMITWQRFLEGIRWVDNLGLALRYRQPRGVLSAGLFATVGVRVDVQML